MRTILNTILLMSLCSSARGQEVPDSIKHNPITESDVKLSEVVVTGLTGSQKLKQSPSPVSIISPRQLEAQPSTNIIDAIAHQPGISQVTTGSGISKPVIRGLGYNRVVVVNDGIRQEGQQWGDEHGPIPYIGDASCAAAILHFLQFDILQIADSSNTFQSTNLVEQSAMYG